MEHLDRPPQPGRLVRVLVTRTVTEGQLARGLLESQGIPVLVKGETEGPYRMGVMELWVPEGVEVQARTIIAEARGETPARDGERPEP